ncbi:MAG TPA: hypothetical protein VLE89_03890 [Chlamydiales bacterium]|nr:hypothetical protein [Chlamydiales bacterium]
MRFFIPILALIAFYPTFAYFWGVGLFSPKKEVVGAANPIGAKYLQSERPHVNLVEALEQVPRIAAERAISVEAVERVILYHIRFSFGKKTVFVADVNAGLDSL